MRLARSLIQEVKEVRGGEGEEISLIVNMQGQAKANEVSKVDIEKAMEMPAAAYLPYDAKIFLGNESESRKLTDDKDARAMIEQNLLPVMKKALGKDLATGGDEEEKSDAGFVDQILAKLKVKK